MHGHMLVMQYAVRDGIISCICFASCLVTQSYGGFLNYLCCILFHMKNYKLLGCDCFLRKSMSHSLVILNQL